MDKKIYEDLFKNVVINGHYPFEKLNEIKNYIKTLNIKINDLEQQCKKQKEVINRAIEYINKYDDDCYTDATCKYKVAELNITKLLDILKEVSE